MMHRLWEMFKVASMIFTFIYGFGYIVDTYRFRQMQRRSKEISDEAVVHQFEGKWYFWNEVWSERIGPYDTQEECEHDCREYANRL